MHSWLVLPDLNIRDGQRFDTHHQRAVGALFGMDLPGFDPAIDQSHRDVRHYGGVLGCDHDGVARRALDAQGGQRAAPRSDDIEFVNLDRLFSLARFRHVVSP